MMPSKLQKSLIVLVNRMIAVEYSQDTIEQTLYVFLVAKEELRENAIHSVNKMLDKKLLEEEFLHEISKLCIEVMNKHTPEELKEAIRKRERERGQN